MSKEISRRKFLRMAGLTAAGVFFSSCASKEPTSTSKPEPKGSEPIATVKPTETRLPPTPTAVLTRIPAPTEAPKPTPTEILREKWGKVWILGGGEGTGGPESGLPKEEERFGSFIEQITRQLEQKGESLKQTELFVGAFPKPLLNEKGKPKFQTVGDQPAGEWLFCAFVFSKTGERRVYCATEQERGIEAQVGAVSEVFTPEPKIWGTGCWEKIDGSRVLSCTDGTTYKPEKTVFGADLTKLTLVSGEETMTGYIFTAVPFQQEQSSPLTFFLSIKDEEKLPFLPSGKEKFDLEKFIAVFDLASARWNVWEDNLEKDYPYVGYWDLEKGEWAGKENYQGEKGYQRLFKEEEASWLPKVSNAEVRFNQEENRWEYYSTDSQEQDQYIVSVRQNTQGEYEFYNYAEELNVGAHPEVCVDATFAEIREIMIATGAVKYIPCSRKSITIVMVHRFPNYFDNAPVSLTVYPAHYPLKVYYPYLEGGQVDPGYPLKVICLSDVNNGKDGWETRWVQLYALDDLGKPRVMSAGESLVGDGILAEVGTPVMEVQSGLVELAGRGDYGDLDNRMLLDSFARDFHGRLMLPVAP